jgi:UDPglucose 6-dehydrogenase
MTFLNAEIAKIAINGYLTTKISLANQLARLCERLPGGDVDAVTSAMRLDSRIGGKYLKGAIAFGGPCFPRDNLAFAALARSVGAPATLAEATEAFNQQQSSWLAEFVRTLLPSNGRAGILGLAYKPDTAIVEESAGLRLAQALLAAGIPVTAYDPRAMPEAEARLPAGVRFAASAADCIRQADIVICTTPWDEFRNLAAADFLADGRRRTLIDCWRLLGHLSAEARLSYVPLGIGPEA